MCGPMRSTALACLLLLNACTSWRVQPGTAAELVAERQPKEVRLRGEDGRQTVLRQPFIRSDSLLGRTKRDTAGLALNEVRAIEVRRFDWLKTTGAVILTFGVTMGVACALACSMGPISFTVAP
jgi:hypothetical protein